MAQAWDSTSISTTFKLIVGNFDSDAINFDSDAINIDDDVANFGYNNIEFDNFDLGGLDNNFGMNYSANTGTANFNFEDVFKETELLLGPQPHEAIQESNMSLPVDPLELSNEKSEALMLAKANNTDTSPLQEPVHYHGMPIQK